MEVVKRLMTRVTDVSLVQLSRNYGKEIAMAAGFDYFHHDAMITMDADLQHPSSVIPDMLALWERGYEDVYAKRNKRDGESWFKRTSSRWYYKVLSMVSDAPVIADAGDYRLLDKKVVAALVQLREGQRYTKGLYSWVGFKKASVEFDAGERLHGKTKFKLKSMLHLAMQGITSHTTAPLKASMYFGFLISAVAFIYMIYVLIKTMILGSDASGFPSLMIVILFLGGSQLISVGILGEYLSRIFNETKHRPLYFVENVLHAKKQTASIKPDGKPESGNA